MKKYVLSVLASIFLIFITIFIGKFENSSQSNLIEDIIFFNIQKNASSEIISCWSCDGSNYYVFLPSYATLSNVQIQFKNIQVYIDGMKIDNGSFFDDFLINTSYRLQVGEDNSFVYSLEFIQSDNIATMYIQTESGDMKYIHADKDHEENIIVTLYDSEGKLEYVSSTFDSISGRGNSTWQYYEKKPYILTLSEPNDLLNIGIGEKWILLANAIDNTNLRNKLIYDFAHEVGINWAPNCEFIDLYLNGEYAGLYLLCEKVENVLERLGVNQGGYLFDLDLATRISDLNAPFIINKGVVVEIVKPKACSEVQIEFLKNRIMEMNDTILSEDGVNIDTGKIWTDYIDIDSWARKYLIEEIFQNYDAGACSQYFYWLPDIENDKIYAGPLWDYDNTLGLQTHYNPRCFLAQRVWKNANIYTPWYKALCQKETFYNYVVDLYKNIFEPQLQSLLSSKIDEAVAYYLMALEMNHLRWISLYGDLQVSDSIDYMKSFLRERVEFLNSAWIEGVDYCAICLKVSNSDYLYYAVQSGTNCEELPTPLELGILNADGWYNEATGKIFNMSQCVTEDLSLYIKENETNNENNILGGLRSSLIPPLCIILLLFLFWKIDTGRRFKKVQQ